MKKICIILSFLLVFSCTSFSFASSAEEAPVATCVPVDDNLTDLTYDNVDIALEAPDIGTGEMRDVRSGTFTSLSRDDVFTRAQAMANFEWVVLEDHKQINTNNPNSFITVPDYVMDADVGDVVVGIPYCWGGFNGYDNGSSSFATVVQQSGKTAGNINTQGGGHQTNTIGLDCSGFVSSAYGFSSHWSSSDLCDDLTEIQFSQLRPMDMMGAPNVHVVLYVSHSVGSGGAITYQIYDSCTTMENVVYGKVSYHSMSKRYADGKNYAFYTPWYATCIFPQSYHSSASYHWRECVVCERELREMHFFKTLNGVTRCTVCGYVTSNGGGGTVSIDPIQETQ